MSKADKQPEYFTPLHHELAAQLGYRQTPGYASWDKVEETAPVQVIERLADYFTTAQHQLLTELMEHKDTYNLPFMGIDNNGKPIFATTEAVSVSVIERYKQGLDK